MDEARRPGYWAVLPAAVRYDTALTAAAKILYAEISAMTESRGYCFASNRYFMELYGITERTLQRHLNALADGGYIRILDGGGGKTLRKIYAGINPLGTADEGPQPDMPGSGASRTPPPTGKGANEGETPPDKNDGGPPSKMSPPPDKNDGGTINSKSYQEEKNNPPKAPQGAGADYEPKKAPDWKPERFAAFWKFYPLHTSKQRAIRAWDKLKPSDELLAVIGRALKRQIAEKAAECERQHRPFEWKLHAATYLNNARWTDEPETTEPGAPIREEGLPWI